MNPVAKLFAIATLTILSVAVASAATNIPELSVDLDIFNGQGGAEVPDDVEVSLGAFTVANLNDTDGDGIIDNIQATVANEVDLMKMIIRKPSRNVVGENLVLTLKSGDAKVWTSSSKGTEVVLPKTYKYEDTEVTLWVEATDYSRQVRDIESELTYAGAKDNVKATGIWAVQTRYLNKDTDKIPVQFPFAGDPLLTWWKTKYDSLLGKAINPRAGVQYGWCFEFQVFPPNVGAEPGVVFDVTRQKNAWFRDQVNGKNGPINFIPWPPGVDDANDDHYNDPNSDNDDTPDHDLIYSIDGPGLLPGAPDAGISRKVSLVNFREFVRATVNGKKMLNLGNVSGGDINTQGSRCSDKFLWHMAMDVVPSADANVWKERSAGSFNSGLGHITLPAH